MNKPSDGKLVSIVGSRYLQPIATLLDALFSKPSPGVNEVQTSPHENGFACAICLLAVVCFESCAMRVRYFDRDAPAAERRTCLGFLRDLYPQFPNIDQLTEVFVLRDIIAHNHLWEIAFSWGELRLPMTVKSASKDSISGDTKYPLHVDAKTNVLQLNAVPVKVDRSDVLKLLNAVWNALMFLEEQDRNLAYVSPISVIYAGELRLFGEVLSSLQIRLPLRR